MLMKKYDVNMFINFHNTIIRNRRKVEMTIKYINFRRLFDVILRLFIISLTINYRNYFSVVGSVAQLVEQWTENPCVAGSIPARATSGNLSYLGIFDAFSKFNRTPKSLCCFGFYLDPFRYIIDSIR